MTLIERLRDPLSSDNWLTDRRDAADEIERSHKELNQKAAYIAKLEDEIERLTACVEHHQAVEADQERAIERLQSELEVWKANAETNLGEVERLQKHHAEAQHKIGEYVDLTARLRSALERIEDMAEPYIASIATEALRDE